MANTFKYGSGVWATKKGSSLAYNDQDDNYKPLPFTADRSSTATRVNKEGLIEVVGQDKLRIDYTDSTKGVALLEPARTNLITYSEDFTNAYWTKQNSTASQSGVVGTITCSSDGNFGLQTAANTSSNVLIAVSIYVQDTSGNNVFYLSTRTSGQGLSGFRSVKFDLSTQIVVNIDNGESATITPFADNYYRLTYVFNADTSTRRGFMLYTSGTSGDTFKVKYAQHELGSYPTSYIPTSGSSVTRVADTANGAGNSEVFNDSEGVLYVNTAALANDSTNRLISINDGSSSNRVLLKLDDSSNQLNGAAGGGSVGVILTDETQFNKIAIKYKLNDIAFWVNGFEVDTDNTATMPTGLSQIDFDKADGTNQFYGKTKEIKVYDTALSDTDLEYLTSYRSLTEMATELNLNTL